VIDRKEIIKQYKQTVQPMGIYQIRNLKNGKIFVGSTKNMQGKNNSYKFQLQSGTHMNRALQEDYTAMGEANFVFEEVDLLKPKEDLKYDYTEDLAVLEEMWLDKLEPYGDKGYNTPKKRK
jgi:hypothetical protein